METNKSNKNECLTPVIDFNLITDFFKQIDRQGPGAVEMTIKALEFVGPMVENTRIADIGCGTGGQTQTLRENTKSSIKAVDLLPQMIEKLKERIWENSLGKRIEGIVASMDNLPFRDEEFDLIWAEGSIYHIGFERGINEWKRFLKPGGYLAVSEVTWLRENPPKEIKKYWTDAYPEIDFTSTKLKQMEKAGYEPVATFVLPEYCWMENYYKPMLPLFDKFLEQQSSSESARKFVEEMKEEISYFEKYKDYYSYTFFIGRRY